MTEAALLSACSIFVVLCPTELSANVSLLIRSGDWGFKKI